MLVTPSNISDIDFWEGVVMSFNKPAGYSSFKLVHQVKKIICRDRDKKLKIGHAGTLDPLATGLLLLCTGRKTKEIEKFQNMVKCYSGTIVVGASRPTHDLESEIDCQYQTSHIHTDLIEEVRSGLTGIQYLSPPVHSAVKINGKRAYELAREGREFTIMPKPMCIHKFEIDTSGFPEIYFEVTCSKGTYIRSLASEFGKRLKSGAYLSALSRDSIGDYTLNDAWSLEQFINMLSLRDRQ